jgi:hypothetical protein
MSAGFLTVQRIESEIDAAVRFRGGESALSVTAERTHATKFMSQNFDKFA